MPNIIPMIHGTITFFVISQSIMNIVPNMINIKNTPTAFSYGSAIAKNNSVTSGTSPGGTSNISVRFSRDDVGIAVRVAVANGRVFVPPILIVTLSVDVPNAFDAVSVMVFLPNVR